MFASGAEPTVALAFCSVRHDFAALGRQLGARDLAVVGVTTAGEIADSSVLEEGCAVMLLSLAPGTFAIYTDTQDGEASVGPRAERLGHFATDRFAEPVVITFASGLSTDGETLVESITTGAERALPLFGGLAGDDLAMEQTSVFSSEYTSDEGLMALVLDGSHYEVEGVATSGWQPVGIEKTVTHAEGNTVYTLDDEPALQVYEKYFGLHDEINERRDLVKNMGVQYPLYVKRENGNAVIRAPMLPDFEADALIFAGAVPEQARVRFCVPPSFDVVDQVVEEAGELHARLPDAEALLLISCKARHMALGPMVEDEIRGLHQLWDVPMAGYFSYGEIGTRPSQRCDFHNETCSLVALKEKQHSHE